MIAFLWIVVTPGPMHFARGQRVRMADYRGPDPTGVPAELASASLLERGSYLAHDADAGIVHYSDANFLKSLHQGIRPDGTHLYPAIPSASYTYITDADALAIKAYLFGLQPVHAVTPSSALIFPFN